MSRPQYLALGELVNEVLDNSSNDESENRNFSNSETEAEDYVFENDSNESSENIGLNFDIDPLYTAKDGTIWSPEPYTIGRSRAENVISLRPGVTRNASSRVGNIRDSMLLFFPISITKIIIGNSNKYGKELHGDKHLEIDEDLLLAFLSVLLLAGVYKSKNETLHDLFDTTYGRPIFRTVMTERTFLYVLKVIRFDDVLSRREGRSEDKFAPNRDLWERSATYYENWCEN